MLVEFRVKNFRSFRDEQVLSLVASKQNELKSTNIIHTGIQSIPKLLPSAVIYGANASGKSNLIKALHLMLKLVMKSTTFSSIGKEMFQELMPFRLDKQSVHDPIEFELTCLIEKVPHQYGFSILDNRVIEEHLLVYKTRKPQRWFSRRFNAEEKRDIYHFSPHLKGSKKALEKATGGSLFLTVAGFLGNENLEPIHHWFLVNFLNSVNSETVDPEIRAEMLEKSDGRNKICSFLQKADISIDSIELVNSAQAIPSLDLSDFESGDDATNNKTNIKENLRFRHTTENGQASLLLRDESGGTKKLLSLSNLLFDVLDKGKLLIIDELDASLHPLLIQEIVKLFHDTNSNPHGAQLIFTAHNTSLINSPHLFRRDQIWFTEKGYDQASSLVSLAEFSPRKNEALEKGYLEGRYGGIPLLNPTGLK